MSDKASAATRAGRYVMQVTGYRAFVPKPLPPDPPLRLDFELASLLSDASTSLGRLDSASQLLPNADLFVVMYVHKEAVLSSQIEGTQASLVDVLAFEADAAEPENPQDVEEVVNYVAALNHGLKRLETLPLSLRLIREIHSRLMKGVRGAEKHPGEFRTSQNWIGRPGSAITTPHAAQVILHALLAGPGPEMFDAIHAFTESAPRAEFDFAVRRQPFAIRHDAHKSERHR